MSNLKPDSVIACLDCPDHVQAVLEASMWASTRMQAPVGLLHSVPSLQQKAAVNYSGCLNIDDENTLLEQFTTTEHLGNCELKSQGKLLLHQATTYCEQQRHKLKTYTLHRHENLSESIDYVDDEAQLIVIGHHVTCKSTLGQLIRVSHCPILVTHAPFLPPTTALFAFDNSPTSHKLLNWLCKTSLVRALTVHIVMVGKENSENCDALREAYARLRQAGIKSKKALLDCRDVTAALNYYQTQNNIGLLMTGAFGQSRLRGLLKGSDTKKLLHSTKTPYLLLPKDYA
ncbi:MAG: universal stress protein [Psychrobacter sp.]|uniref:Universal stress protein UspA n=1 Tax=Psychrobacter alimentarius TaxID=261164 RepID=A0ABM6A165_9GAMM|nr:MULTISPECIES: universal stress protein [Psychrobacter]AMT98165.1 Universal stress protein UspA [Psychrobacter alimentarius]MBO6223882.1 universal stress protein [Psychrobacter sp.]QCB29571.1 universal stress protein [Psychrobacter sp. PAMC27889]